MRAPRQACDFVDLVQHPFPKTGAEPDKHQRRKGRPPDAAAMKAMMDGVAEGIRLMAQRYLPDRPHHLSLSADARFPVPGLAEGYKFAGASASLQYMTYLSDANRGLLLTRPSYEICLDPETTPAPKVMTKGDTTKNKKLSLKDYRNRKKTDSPPDNAPSAKTEGIAKSHLKSEIGMAGCKVKGKKEPKASSGSEGRHDDGTENQREDLCRHNDGLRRRERHDGPSPGSRSRKRSLEAQDDYPQKKRAISEAVQHNPEAGRLLNAESMTERERMKEKVGQKENKGTLLPPIVNGHKARKTFSPRPASLVNGSKPASQPTRKSDGAAISRVPELLSPLHPSFERELDEHDRATKKTAEKAPSKKREKEKAAIPALLSPDLPVQILDKSDIPELLSPTLPRVVEEALEALYAREEREQEAKMLKGSQASEAPGAKKTKRLKKPTTAVVQREGDENDGSEKDEEENRPSMIVTLKLKKAAKRAKDLLSLPSKSEKKKAGFSSVEAGRAARKRPRVVEMVPEECANKRPKIGDRLSATIPAPSTPGKQASTAMSRVASNQSLGNTPGNTTGRTWTSDRPLTRSDGHEKGLLTAEQVKQREREQQERYEEYFSMGVKLKRTRDDILKERGEKSAADEKLCALLTVEMVLAWMLAFDAYHKPQHRIQWFESLLPHLMEMKNRTRGHRPLLALTCQISAITLEQLSAACAGLDTEAGPKSFVKWSQYSRQRTSAWTDAVAVADDVDDQRMKTAMGPWTKVTDAVHSALTIVVRWAELDRDNIRWQPSIDRHRGAFKGRPNGTRI